MITQYLQIYAARSGIQGKVEVIQKDSGRNLKCQIMDMTIPEGCTARIYGRKPTGLEIYNDCIVRGNAVLVELTAQLLAEIGIVPAQIELTLGGKTVTSFEFLLVVKRSLAKNSAIESSNEFTALEKALNDARTAAYQAVYEYIEANGTEVGVTDEKIQEAVEKYLAENPVTGISKIYMRVFDGYIQYSSDGETYNNLIAVSDLKGEPGERGVGIRTIAQTATSTEDKGLNVYTITLTNGNKSQFVVRNGSKGSPGTDGVGIQNISQSTGNPNGGKNTITIALTNGNTRELYTYNGKKGDKGDIGEKGEPGSDASVTAENIKNALGYTPAKQEDVNRLSKEIDDLKQSLEDDEQELIGQTPYILAEDISSLILKGDGEHSFTVISDTVADLENISSEPSLLNCEFVDMGGYYKLTSTGGEKWYQSYVDFFIDGLTVGGEYVLYIDAVGRDWDVDTYNRTAGHHILCAGLEYKSANVYGSPNDNLPAGKANAFETDIEALKLEFTATMEKAVLRTYAASDQYFTSGLSNAEFNSFYINRKGSNKHTKIVNLSGTFTDTETLSDVPKGATITTDPVCDVYTTVISNDIEIVQTTGESETSVMSQKAVTLELDSLKSIFNISAGGKVEEFTRIMTDKTIFTENKFCSHTSGNVVDNTTYCYTEDYFEFPESGKLMVHYGGGITNQTYPVVVYYDENKTFIGGEVGSHLTQEDYEGKSCAFYNVPENTRFIRLNVVKNYYNEDSIFNNIFLYVITEKIEEDGVEIPGLIVTELKKLRTKSDGTEYETLEDAIWEKARLLTGKTIVNFGDSIFGNARPPQDISTFLADITGATVHNCAFGGCRMGAHVGHYDAFSMYRLADAIVTGDYSLQDDALNYDDKPSYAGEPVTLLKSIDFNKVDIVTIAYGTNDWSGYNKLDNADNQYDINYFGGALRYSIERLLGAFPHLKIFILCPTYRFWMDENLEFTEDSDTKASYGETLLEYVELERTIAKNYHLPFIDNYYDLGINKFNRSNYFPSTDGTHHNKNGRILLAEHIAKELF